MKTEIEKFKQERMRIEEEKERYLNQREFGINKAILKEIADEDLEHAE